ncbi:MAG: hypothetical protein HUU50_19570, partial [Candidatus Brocadiae bacterium]|nr:hypothetical protein [Candidatus Brocadiia bacterium]
MKILFFCMLMLCLIFCKAQEEKQAIALQKMISYVEEMQKNNARENTLASRQSKHAPSVHVNILKASMLGDGENFWDNQEAIELVFAANLAIDLISTRDDFGYLIQSIAFWYERNRYTRHFFLKADEIHQDVRRLARSAPFNSGGTEGMHFDDLFSYREICQRWEEFEAWVLREVNVAQSSREHWDRQGRRDFLILMGMVSHSVQDFYAHSNLVRLILDHNRRSSVAIQPCWEDIVALEKHTEASKSLNYGLWQWCIQSNETVTSESEYSSEKWLGLQTGSWGKKDKLYDKRHSQWKKPWKHRDEDHSLALALSGRTTIH